MHDDNTGRTRSSSTLQRRADRQTRHARMLRSSLDRHDVSQAEIAALCGVAPSKVARWLDPDSLDRPAAHELEEFPHEVAVDVLRALAVMQGYTLAQLPAGTRVLDDVHMLAAAAQESGEAVAAAAACIRADGHPSLEQLLTLERETTEAIETLAAMRERARSQVEALRSERSSRPRPIGIVGGGSR